ncbi:chromosome partitioning protein ParB, partial [Desulfosarcina sp. OttesenSCG-928-G17]|nr:chromosome partitioning protein ParB [Desulfosarcina sp. OttesenSCG-928-G17]
REVIAKKLSVRETESLVRRLNIQAERPAAISEPSSEDRYFNDVSENLSRYFGTRVYIRRKGKRGRLEIDFFSDEDLDRLLTMLKPR